MLSFAFRRLVSPSVCRNLPSSISSSPRSEVIDAQRCRYIYSPGELRRLRTKCKRRPIDQTAFNLLRDYGMLRPFRGCRAGKALKFRNHVGSLNIQPVHQSRRIYISNPSRPPRLSCHAIPIHHAPVPERRNSREFGPSIALANMMSLGPKIDELRCFANVNKPDLISLTETWIYDDTAAEHHLHLPGYNLCLKNRQSGVHGGVGLYINNTIKYKPLTDLYHSELEVLWAHLRPVRLPRGFPCIVSGTVYHTLYPDGASDAAMIEYLISSLTTIEGRYPGCGILLSGDFNRLNISRLQNQFKLKQLVCVPTRGDQTLDLILTNMPHVYNKDLVQTLPPFGLSDHLVVLLEPMPRIKRNTSSRRSFTRRDTRASRKCELGRYLGSIDWSILDCFPDCESKLHFFQDLVKIGLDTIMPFKTIKLHVNDPPWVTAEFKSLIKARQKAFAQGDIEGYRHLRNVTNRERKLCRGKFYASKVANLKTTKPSQLVERG